MEDKSQPTKDLLDSSSGSEEGGAAPFGILEQAKMEETNTTPAKVQPKPEEEERKHEVSPVVASILNI